MSSINVMGNRIKWGELGLVLLTIFSSTIFGQENELDVRPLVIGEMVERPLKGGEVHFYIVELKPKQVLQINLLEKGVNAQIILFRTADKQSVTNTSFGFGYDRETLTTVIEQAGVYAVVIGAQQQSLSGNYQMTAKLNESAEEKDNERITAERLLAEGVKGWNKGTLENVRGAIGKWEKSLSLWQSLEEKYWEGYTRAILGRAYSDLGEKLQALIYDNEAVLLFRAVGDKSGEAMALNNIGKVYSDLGENRQALKYFDDALPLRRAVGDKSGEAAALTNIGAIYSDLGNGQLALKYYNDALLIFRGIGDERGETVTLNNIGKVYDDLGEEQQALKYYNDALLLFRASGNKHDEAYALYNIGGVYDDLGEKQQALKFFDDAVSLYRVVGDKRGEAIALNNIGSVYDELGDGRQALKFFTDALVLCRAVGDKREEARIFNKAGEILFAIGEKQQALKFFNDALSMFRAVGYKRGEAATLNNISGVYHKLGDNRQSLKFISDALLVYRAAGDKSGEAASLINAMYVQESLDNRSLAIFYGKQSVNIYQQLRSNIKGLDKETQKTYLKSIERNYRLLTHILIAENRLPETQQILNSFKDQQFFDFDELQVKQSVPLALTAREADFISRYEKSGERVGTIGGQIEELKRKIGAHQPSVDETSQIQKLESDLKSASDEFLAVLKQAEIEFSKPKDEKDKVGEIPDLRDMQTALRELSANTKHKAAAVYQLVGEEKFHLLVITADEIKSVSTPVKNSVLNQKALDFWALLQSPVYDPNLVGKELYDVVFKPLESVLPKDTKTILWSLDGNLRYVPMAALFDGKQYLAERFNHVNFTRADKERMTRAAKPNWTAVGFGTSEAKTVELLGSQISFEALPGVGEELKMLFKKTGGIFDGETLRDAEFTRQKMLDALRQKRPLVHIASHFSFRAGDEARSFLLLGDGTAFTLADMKNEANLFEGVELLTLSACNTAAQQAGANGREIDGFAELAQRLGANSVMATLWSVADSSTPWLMREFYNLKLNKNQNKAESLRQAQLALLNGKAEIKPFTTRTDLSPVKIVVVENEAERKKQTNRSGVYYLNKKNAPLWEKDKHPPFAHPFYWSPFIMFGNWR